MPVYDYQCDSCHSKTERYAKVDERHNQLCQCGGILILKIPKSIAIHYHADGFAHQELAKQRHNQLIAETSEEGFVSHMEQEIAVEQGITRAQKKGIDPALIVGQETYESGKIPSLEDEFEKVMD